MRHLRLFFVLLAVALLGTAVGRGEDLSPGLSQFLGALVFPPLPPAVGSVSGPGEWYGRLANASPVQSMDGLELTFTRMLGVQKFTDRKAADAFHLPAPDALMPQAITANQGENPVDLSHQIVMKPSTETSGDIYVFGVETVRARFHLATVRPHGEVSIHFYLPPEDKGRWHLDGVAWLNGKEVFGRAAWDREQCTSDIGDMAEHFMGHVLPIGGYADAEGNWHIQSRGWHVEGEGVVGAVVKNGVLRTEFFTPLVTPDTGMPTAGGRIHVTGMDWAAAHLRVDDRGFTEYLDRRRAITGGATQLIIVRDRAFRPWYWHTNEKGAAIPDDKLPSKSQYG